MKQDDRRHLIYTIIQDHDTLSNTEIRRIAKDKHNIKLHEVTTQHDIKFITTQNYKWMHQQAKDLWAFNVRFMYEDTKNDIKLQNKIIENLLKFEGDPEFTSIANHLKETEMDDDTRRVLTSVIKDVYNKTPLSKVAGKIAYALSVKTDKSRFLVEMMQDQPLYEALQKYSKEYHNWESQMQLKDDNTEFRIDNK